MVLVLSSHFVASPLPQLAAQVSRRSGTTRPSKSCSFMPETKRNQIYVPDVPFKSLPPLPLGLDYHAACADGACLVPFLGRL
jgi:hypothetical protein